MSEPEAPTDAGAELARLAERFRREADAVEDRDGFDDLRVRWMGRKQGLVRSLLGRMREIPPAQRREFGQGVNLLKAEVEGRLEELEGEIERREAAAARAEAAVDVTLPGRRVFAGTVHPTHRVIREMAEIFAELGYSVAEGPEVESDYHNFEALNMPPEHPARDTQDTFFLPGGDVLRTHTSPVQIRVMESRRPPIRIICPGRVYRRDNTLRHSPMFHQVEGLAVAEGITFADLRGTLEAFLQRLFSPDIGVRLRPSYFPFTEPSAEVDITCPFCDGGGCATCSQSGWMEILGAGMVNPRVLEKCGIDPRLYTGFAFGMGVDRVAMIRHGIPNIRMLFDNDERLLRQIQG